MKRTLIAALAVATMVSPAVAGPYGPFHGYTIGLDQSQPAQTESATAKAMFAATTDNDAGTTIGQDKAGTPTQVQTPAAKAMFAAQNNPFES